MLTLVILFVLVGTPLACVYLVLRRLRQWKTKFTFTITDVWAFFVGLTPFYVTVPDANWDDTTESSMPWGRILIPAMLFLWLCAGMFVVRTLLVLADQGKPTARLVSALGIIIGALGGFVALLLAFMSVALIWRLLFPA